MAKKSVMAREVKRQQLVAKYAARRAEYKATGNYDALEKLPLNSNPIRLRNRCKLTGRPRGYIRDFGLCRVVFRQMALDGKLPGVRKSSW